MILLAFVICICVTDGWTQFRGPHSNGHAMGSSIPMEWSESKNVTWKTPIPGLGWSSPVISDGKVFLTTAVVTDSRLSLRAIALSTETGKLVWDREIRQVEKAPAIHSKNSHASPTPIVHNGSVFVHFGALGMARLSTIDGTIQWTCNELDYPPMHGSGGSPVLHNGKLVIACDGSKDPFVAAVDAESGKVVWKRPRSVAARINHSFVTATIAMVNGEAQVLAPGPDHFAAYDLNSGEELWRVLAPGWSVVPQPVIAGDMVIYNHDYDNPELIAIKLGGVGDVTDSHVAWRSSQGAPSTPSPLLIGQELYYVSDSGVASCIDAQTGDRHWMERLGGNYSASPVYVNGHILFLNESGLAIWIEPSRQFKVKGKNEIEGRTLATPAFDSDAMFLRTDQYLYKIAG